MVDIGVWCVTAGLLSMPNIYRYCRGFIIIWVIPVSALVGLVNISTIASVIPGLVSAMIYIQQTKTKTQYASKTS